MTTTLAQDITLIADPKVIAIPIIDNDEPCIDLREQTKISYGPSPEIPNNQDYFFLRRTVYQKLIKAQDLLPFGYKFRIYEGYRSIELQSKLFNTRYNTIQKANPSWDHEEIFLEAIKLVSPIKNLDGSTNIPPHATGGAFDIYLIDKHDQLVDMGMHPKDWLQDTSGKLSKTASDVISTSAQNNRSIMNKALNAAGFVNYPTEYWHWSYGDRYWAFMLSKKNAIYSALDACNNHTTV